MFRTSFGTHHTGAARRAELTLRIIRLIGAFPARRSALHDPRGSGRLTIDFFYSYVRMAPGGAADMAFWRAPG